MSFSDRPEHHDLEPVGSVVCDLLNTAVDLDVLDEARGMVINGHIYTKAIWKKLVSDRAWVLEDTFGMVQSSNTCIETFWPGLQLLLDI